MSLSGSDSERSGALNIVEALSGAGDVGRDLLNVDWDSTPLGTPESWPRSLSTMARVVVSSRFSMWMAWGPELTFFCNDAYRRDTLGTKYPWALGRPAREVWAEIWDDIGPRIETVLRTGVATWDESLLLFLERSGYVEETYHTFSYSPLTDDLGAIVGMLCVVSEGTEQVVGERRMATLRELGSESATGRDDRGYLRAAANHLATNNQSLPFTLTYLFGDDGTAELVCTTGIADGHPATVPILGVDTTLPWWPLPDLRWGSAAVVDRIGEQLDDVPTGFWELPPTQAAILPLRQPLAPDQPYGFLVVGANRYRPLDDQYLSFLGLIAAQLASGISNARAYELERRRAEELAELDRAKTAFFTNVSHELRTPLTLLLGPAEDALADPEEDLLPSQRRRLEMIARNGERLLKLVNTLLDFSRLEAGRAEQSFEPVDLAQYTAELASMFDSAVERAGLRFEIDCPPLPKPVYVDREMWAKVVLNLLSNALKFTFSGGITVRVGHGERSAWLEVADTGIGVELSEQARLFERFHRVSGARARTSEGSGIGLALVAELAEVHGGTAAVESMPGAGSKFTVEIPFGRAHLRDDQLASDAREVSVEREVAGFLAEANRWLRPAAAEPGVVGADAREPNRPRVLVVDDNTDMRDYVVALLADDYSVQTASDGQAALVLARADPPDLVLTDVMMPRLDGFGLLAALHADPATLHVPVVMLSARAGEEGVVEGLQAGADDYLIKPFSARELLARVGANLELDRARRTREQLERSQVMQNQAERLAEVGSWEIDLESGLIRGSQQLLRMLHMPGAGFGALQFKDAIIELVHPDDLERVQLALEAALSSGEAFESELRLQADPGDEQWMRVRGEVISDEGGQPKTFRGFVQDITQRRAAESAIATAATAREAAAREHAIADSLQRSLLPNETFESVHLEVATYYQAGVEGTRVGGDWFDVIDLGAGRAALVIGDVSGRGIRAASLMGQLRAAGRAYARLDLPPAEVLELLEATVEELGQSHLATCIYGVYDPATSEFRYANAGHLPPILALPGQAAARLPGTPDPPLGFGSSKFREERLSLPAGALIVLYTDGLVERRDRDLDVGIDMLTAHVSAEVSTLQGLPGALVQFVAPDANEDDIAILVARIGESSVQRLATLEVPGERSAVKDGRRFTVSTLNEWSLPERLIEDATLMVSELLTNAIVHGHEPIRLRLRLRKTSQELAIEVDDGSSAMPRKLRAGPEDLHGRGLAIVAELGARWAARPDGYGKTVWSTIPIPPG